MPRIIKRSLNTLVSNWPFAVSNFVERRKDPGIPNLFPFKEQVLKQIQERKERDEETRQRQKEQRHKEHAKRRSLQSFQNDIAKRTKQYEKKVTF